MSRLTVEARFDKARKRLSSSLKELEETVKIKIHEASEQQIKIVSDSEKNNETDFGGRYSLPSYNLAAQVNQLQKDLLEVGKELEFQCSDNRILLERIENFQQEKMRLVTKIEENLEALEKLVDSENKAAGGDSDS